MDFNEFFSLQYKELYFATSGLFELCYNHLENTYLAIAYKLKGRGFESVIFEDVDFNVVRDKCFDYDNTHSFTIVCGRRCYI